MPSSGAPSTHTEGEREREICSVEQIYAMASSDASTSSGSEYQVFLSFRRPDTGVGFTDFLFHSLIDAGVHVFRDDEELRVGERIDGSLQRAIDNSKIYIPVFSRTYASSQWCLRELAQIVANTSKSEGKKEILPIFFDVEPDDVKLKTLLYRDAILNLEREKKLSNEQVDAWREALMEVDAIKGWEVKKYKGYGDVIKLIVEEVVQKLKTKHRSVTEHLVGIDDRVAALTELLDVGSDGVRLIGIHGMGGIGKTTLAKVVFNQLSSNFGKCCCFMEDVRAKSLRTDGLIELQKKLLSQIGHPTETRSIDEIDYGTKRIEEVLSNKKVLIALDDVANLEQVEKLVGRSTLNSGSRILITTRNKDILRINRPNYQISEYEMEVMSSDHALELFSRHAFNSDSQSDDYKDLSGKIVAAIGRLPLALEVIGSFLRGKGQDIWRETSEKLSKAPHDDVFEKLKISYDALSYQQQQIFLDIACFFIGEPTTYAIYMWKDCDFFPDAGVGVLISMSLVKIVENTFWMHDQLGDLGREIVHRQNPINPEERSRIWIDKEVLEAIRTKEMKNNVQALTLDLRKSDNKTITSEEIGRFQHLRYLGLSGGTFRGNLAMSLTNMSWIFWSSPPRRLFFKPTNMRLNNVVVLEFSRNAFIDDSKLQSLTKRARKLKVLSLEYCHNIKRMPDFSGCPNLERLNFNGCSNLRKLDGSIGTLNSLIEPKIRSCYSLEDLPEEIGNLVNLKHFSVEECPMKKLPDSIWKLKSLCELHFHNHDTRVRSANSWEIPSAVTLENLEVLRIHSHNLKGRLPSAIGNLPFLRVLRLLRTCINEVPETVSMLPCLQTLELIDCDEIQELPTLPPSLNNLRVSSKSLLVVPHLSNPTNLVMLDLDGGSCWKQGGKICNGDLVGMGKLSKPNKLKLQHLNVPAPAELASLSQLKELCLFGLDLRTLTQLPSSLLELQLYKLNSTVSLSSGLENLSSLQLISSQVQEIQLSGHQLHNLTELILSGGYYHTLERLGLSNLRKLKIVWVSNCPKLVEIKFVGAFESLDDLSIQDCESLGRLGYAGEAESIDELTMEEGRLILLSRVLCKLRRFELACCPKILQIQVLGTSELWKEFWVRGCRSLQSVRGLSNSKKLEKLHIWNCDGLRVVEGLDELEALNDLFIQNRPSLERWIDVSNTKLPNDCRIEIPDVSHRRSKTYFEGTVQSYKRYKESRFPRTCTCFRSL
ncbi:disease resistance protein L6-like [Rhodamnia argentea]|uniref:Disease resistance protein L6-like n=1 Tax=Rhodamnia argentea TaxID=178133 RepID=A0ABM3HX12_9MYRT|nr:disease resistance protein L6-like [Rhodamnia argentea]